MLGFLHSKEVSLLYLIHSPFKLLFSQFRMLFLILCHQYLSLLVLKCLLGFGDRLLDLFYRLGFISDDFRCSFIDGFKFEFLVEILRGFVLDFKIFEFSHLLFHSVEVSVKQSFLLDKVVEVKLFNSM